MKVVDFPKKEEQLTFKEAFDLLLAERPDLATMKPTCSVILFLEPGGDNMGFAVGGSDVSKITVAGMLAVAQMYNFEE